jgi:hypothetical protein
MGRDYSFLIATLILILTFNNCSNANEYPDDLSDYKMPLSEAVGTYIYIPHKSNEDKRDDFNYLDLKKEDTLKLEVKKDSTFIFNYFYHDKAIKTKNFTGKFTVYPSRKNILIFKKYPDESQYIGGTSGFKKGKKIYFYIRLKSPDDNSEYGYALYYQKIK